MTAPKGQEIDPPVPLYSFQMRAVQNPARFTWNCWSRQSGKTFALALRRIYRGLKRRRNQIFLSAGERQSRELMMKARQHLEAMKIAAEFNEIDLFEGTNFKQLEITVPAARIRIIGLPANPNTARGFTGDVLLDEFAMHQHDREIWGAVFPTVLRGEGELDICSTPKGRQNMFYRLRENEEFSRDTVTIDDAIAAGLPFNRERERRALMDDQLWRQEYLCEFVDEATAFLTYELIGECEDATLPRELDLESLAENKGDVVVGIDIGRRRDLTVIWAFELLGRRMVSLGLIELAGARFETQFQIFSDVLNCRCVRRCCIDESGLGMAPTERVVEAFGPYRVEACTFTSAFKAQIAGELRLKFEDKNIAIPVDTKIRNDLHSVRKTVTMAGNIRLDAPREDGSHADRFYAAALAAHAASDDSGPIECELGPPLAMAGMRGARY